MYAKPSEFLADLDSHGIYGVRMLEECEFSTACIPIQTVESMRKEIIARGLGGSFNMGACENLFSGWKAASALAKEYLGKDPGATYHGRGFAFNAASKALAQAGY